MNTSLGINFLRTVNEEGSNGWAQVYARIPFDDYELAEKGALFGVFQGKTEENWADIEAELMEWVDEYFNGVEKGGEMTDFVGKLKDKYSEIDGAWMWVTPKDGGKRELKAVRWGIAGVLLEREGREYDLTIEEGKVVSGLAADKDKVRMWSGTLGEMLKETSENKKMDADDVMTLGNRLVEAREAGAGLFFDFQKYEAKPEERKEEITKNVLEAEVQDNPEEETTEETLTAEMAVQNSVEEDLAGEEIVGKVGVKEKMINWWKRMKPAKRQDLRVEGPETIKRKKWAVFLGIVFLLLLGISLVTGSVKIKADREAKKWNEFAEPINKSIQEASGLVSINPSGAKKLMEDVRSTFEVQKAEFSNGKYKDEVSKLEQKINETWTVASGEKQSTITDLANIQLVRDGFVGDRMSLVKDSNLLILDSKLGLVTSVTTSNKEIKVLIGKGEGQGWIDAASDGSRTLILNAKGVSVDGKETGGIVFDLAVNKPVALGRFGSNVYVLDAGNKEIYKYGASSDGYGERLRWLKQGESIDVNPVDMAMDASVWVLGDNGVIEKFTRGVREQFTLNGLPEGVKAVKLAIQSEGTGLAILDTTNGMVIVCGKDSGNCNQQLKSEKLKSASDIEYDGSGNLLVLQNGIVGSLQ